jgi:trigger factor
MQVTETLTDGLKRAYTVVVPAADIESRRSKRIAELGRTVHLPGFRPGKVPPTIIKQRFGGSVAAEVLEASVNEATRQVLTERGLRSAGQPKVELVSADLASDLEFKVELELLPDIALPDIASIELTRLKAQPQPETIDKALSEIARRQRTLEDVTEDRPAAKGDVLLVDFVGKLDGTAFAGGTGNDVNVEIGGAGFIPGFAEQLEGMRPRETRTIEVTFPAVYGAAELAGKTVSFEVTAKQLRLPVLPAIDEDLAKKLGFEGLQEVRETIGTQVQREYDQLSRQRVKRQLLDILAERVSFPVPQGMVETEFGQIWQRLETERKEGRVDDDDKGKDDDTLKAEYRAIAERRVRLGLLLGEIGRANNITVNQDELLRAVRAEASRYPGQEKQVLEFFRKTPQATDTLRGPIFEEKVVDFVLELAKVTESTVTPEELARDPDAPAVAAAPEATPEAAPQAAPAAEADAGQTAGEVA